MAADIGARIKLDGEKEFRQALKDSKQSLKELGSELKLLESEYADNGSSVKKLREEKGILEKETEAEREQVELLKKRLEEATAAYGENDARVVELKTSLNNAQTALNNTQNEINRLTAEIEKSTSAVEKFAKLGEELKKTGEKISDVGKKMSVASAAITGLATAAVKTTADFDAAMSKVAAVSGATGDDLDALRDKAREMGEKTKFSASEAAEAMNYMAMAGWKTGDMLNGIEGIMNLAAAAGEDLGTTSDIVTDALSAFGLTAADSAHFADILAAASSNANTNVSMMGETFKYAAPVAGALGFSAEDTALTIGLMANAGIKASQAGTSLRGILSRLASPTKESGTAMDMLGISLVDTSENVKDLGTLLDELRDAFAGLSEAEATQYASMLAGRNAMSGLLAIVNAAPADVDKLSEAINNCDGASQSMAETMQDNLSGQLTILKSQTEELQISFGELLIPIIRDVVSHIQAFVDKLNGLDEGQRKTILTIGLVVAAIGPALILIGKVISSVGTILTVLPKVKTAITAVNTVLSANPIGAVIALISALVAAFIYLWNNCEEFRDFFTELWAVVSNAVSTAVDAIGEFFQRMGEKFTEWIESVKEWGRSIIEKVKEGFQEKVDSAKNWGKDLISNFTDGITEKWNNLKQKVTDVANGIKNILGFSEPKEGPLSNFHTYAPDMMDLFAKGIQDKTPALKRQIAESFDLKGDIENSLRMPQVSAAPPMGGMGAVSLDAESLAALRLAGANREQNIVVQLKVSGSLSQIARVLLPELETASRYAGVSLVEG